MILQRIGIPIYLQVKSHILEKIRTGEYLPGSKIPTERELAGELGISRNTVSAAYKELLLEGVLEACQGRGTFVKAASDGSGDLSEVAGGRRERVLKIIDDAMAQVLELGFTVEQFAAFASIRAQERAYQVQELKVAVVDCTAEFAQRFIQQLAQVANVKFWAVTLSELEAGQVSVDLLYACDLVITTLEHQAVVAKWMNGSSKLLTIATVPHLEALIKVARLSTRATVGVIARTGNFVQTLERLLSRIHVSGLKFDVTLSQDQEELRQFVAAHEVLVVAEEREHLVRQLADTQEIIPFYYEIDQGSLNHVAARLVAQTL